MLAVDEGVGKSMDDLQLTEKPGALDLRVWLRLLSCAKIIEKRLRRNFEEQFDTTLPRFDVLATVARQPAGLRMGELSRALLVSNGNVTAIVRQLQEEGLLCALPDPEDGRSAKVSLTPAGRERFRILAAAHHDWVREAMRDFPQDHQAALFDLLGRLRSSLS
jgi:DNA-binding MarR family transcriptional regulator